MCSSLVLVLLLTASLAHADEPVRDDIVDLRHARVPSRRVLLGWTADNCAVVHVADCGFGDGGGAWCTSTLEVIGARTQVIALLAPEAVVDEYGETARWQVSGELASKAIRAERAALATLGPLQPSAPGAPHVTAGGGPCRIDLRIGEHKHSWHALGSQCLQDGGITTYSGATVLDAQLSPDRTWIAVSLRIASRTGEYRGSAMETRVLAVTP